MYSIFFLHPSTCPPSQSQSYPTPSVICLRRRPLCCGTVPRYCSQHNGIVCPSTRLLLETQQTITTWNPNFLPLIEAYPPPDQPPANVPCCTSTCNTVYCRPYLYQHPTFINLRNYPHDHCASVSDQHWCAWSSSIRTSISTFPIPLISCSFTSLFSVLSILSDDLPFL